MLLSMQGISKAFAGVAALKSAALEVEPAEVMALVGQNGAGKSTLIKILTGVYRRDEGSVAFDGTEVDFTMPADSAGRGHRDDLPGDQPRAAAHRGGKHLSLARAETLWPDRPDRHAGGCRGRAENASSSTSTSSGPSRISMRRPGRWWRSPVPSRRTPASSSWTSRPPRSTSARSQCCSRRSAR
jgi:energy-coupling factor transporter ATP-binding protein EcfA2